MMNSGPAKRWITRRRFLKAMLATPVLLGGYTWGIEPTWAEYVHRDLPLRNLPSALIGKTLVHLSDIHVGRQVDSRYLANVFAAVRALAPDFVAYTGDFVTYAGPETIGDLKELLPQFPLGRLGAVAVLGNHDYGEQWADLRVAAEVACALEKAGCRVLRNETVTLHGLRIGGLDELWAGRLKVRTMLGESLLPPHVVLCHNPDGCDEEGWGGYAGWILAGHTHGGQCKPPFLPPPLLPVRNRRYTAGEIALGGRRSLYINRGLGHLLRVRFNARPEVTQFRLVAAQF